MLKVFKLDVVVENLRFQAKQFSNKITTVFFFCAFFIPRPLFCKSQNNFPFVQRLLHVNCGFCGPIAAIPDPSRFSTGAAKC